MEGQVWRLGGGGSAAPEAIDDENARLKRLLADPMLDNAGPKDLLSKKW